MGAQLDDEVAAEEIAGEDGIYFEPYLVLVPLPHRIDLGEFHPTNAELNSPPLQW